MKARAQLVEMAHRIKKADMEEFKYMMFPRDGRFIIGRHVAGSDGYLFTAIEEHLSEKFAQRRVDALNSGEVAA